MFKAKKSKKSIHSLCKHGQEGPLKAMLEKEGGSVLVNTPDSLGRFPIHLAAANGDKNIVQILLDHGADINAEEVDTKWNILTFAAKSGNAELFHLLVTHPDIKVIDVPNKDHNYPTHFFCRHLESDKYGSLEVMFQKGASANAVNYNGETALHNAAWKGNVDICAVLLKHGALVNAQNDRGETPLHWAARQGREAVVRFLFRSGADSAISGLSGTPYDVATPAIKEVIRIEQAKLQHQMPSLQDKKGSGSLTELRKNAPLAWEVNRNEVELGEEIGRGAFGVVRKGKWKNIIIAAKFLKDDPSLKSGERFENFLREVTLMSKLRHPNILLLLGASVEEPMFYLTEYMSRGNLRKVLVEEKDLPWDRKLSLSVEIAKGLEYLHLLVPPVLHHDLKSMNVLIDDDFHARLSDFGMSSVKSSDQMMSGTLSWMAPEVVSGESYTEKSDVYSFGVVMWELATHSLPYEGHGELHVISAIVEGMHPEFPSGTNPDFQTLGNACMELDPSARPDITTAWEKLRKIKLHYLETQASAGSLNASRGNLFDLASNTLSTSHSSSNVTSTAVSPLPSPNMSQRSNSNGSGRFRSNSSDFSVRKNSSTDLKTSHAAESIEAEPRGELRPSRSDGALNASAPQSSVSPSSSTTEVTSSSNSESPSTPTSSPNITPTQARAKAVKASRKREKEEKEKAAKRSSGGTRHRESVEDGFSPTSKRHRESGRDGKDKDKFKVSRDGKDKERDRDKDKEKDTDKEKEKKSHSRKSEDSGHVERRAHKKVLVEDSVEEMERPTKRDSKFRAQASLNDVTTVAKDREKAKSMHKSTDGGH